jgi:hypothetical protein
MFLGKLLRCRPVGGLMFLDTSAYETDRLSRKEKKTIMLIRNVTAKFFVTQK